MWKIKKKKSQILVKDFGIVVHIEVCVFLDDENATILHFIIFMEADTLFNSKPIYF